MSGASRRALSFAFALAFAVSCSESAAVKPSAASDVSGGGKLARDAAAILLRYAAYDYGLAGALAGAKTATVTPARYAVIARDSAKRIGAFSSDVLAATLDRSGPVREKLVPLADGFSDLARDGQSYADGGDFAAFARVLGDVDTAWQRLRDLAAILPQDDVVQAAIARGSALVAAAKPERRWIVTAGPYTSVAEAQQAMRVMASPSNGSIVQASAVVIRIGPYADRASADAAAASLAKVGVTTVVTDEQSFSFARSGPAPTAELWREPARVLDARAGSRKLALSDDGSWAAIGGDDGFVPLFDSAGRLTALPQSFAGISVLAFTDDARFVAVGGQVVTFLSVPGGQLVGQGMRFTGAATQILFVPTTRAFVAASTGRTGLAEGGPGLIGGRAPDGNPLGDPFPIVTPAAGAQIAASDAGDLYIGTTSEGGYDVEMFRPGTDSGTRPIARIPGVGKALAVDRLAGFAAVVTDQGTYRFALADAKALTRLAAPVRDVAFGPDGTLYLLDQTSLSAIGPEGAVRWKAPLVDGRRLIAARRAVVLDGTDHLYVFAPTDGTADELGAGGAITDITQSRDGATIGVVVDQRRAVLFTLP